ncbi:hypothetical protein AMS68_000478 [Peltaster fructicola]|uniref:Nephrocystin 3-like N-terminal domain-containing protein n=1 Tax=Peltaster fructicola TaxID=286661 RepID=A0A6H0XJZ6_9PEZI|nr:hypothetical protein AMS68_000478 [Peltaster fructicola]
MSLEFEDAGARGGEVYRALGQGIEILHGNESAETDILFVPGLGTNPHECWAAKDTGRTRNAQTTADGPNGSSQAAAHRRRFNWVTSADGLKALYPRARIMLYDYASAWTGKYKVRATMKSICLCLLDDLKEKRSRGTEMIRPLIIVGHSMGGIVIAKALSIAKARKEYEAIVTCTMGCIFFGTPFRGSNMAKIALMYSSVFGNEAYESLLQFMKAEKNDTLEEVVADFVEISAKANPPIDLYCVYEEEPTKTSYAEKGISKMNGLLQHNFFKAGATMLFEVGLNALGAGTHFVDKESAVLQTAKQHGMTAGHSDLVRFNSMTDQKFLPVKIELDKMIRAATVNVRRRTFLSGQNLLTQRFVNQVRQTLEGVDMQLRYRAKAQNKPNKSWLLEEKVYQEWCKSNNNNKDSHSYLFVKSRPGLGKTDACIAAIKQIGRSIDEQQSDLNVSQNRNFLAYFLCEWSSGCCTAEDVLKNIITQLISQEGSLAQHARWFVSNPRYQISGEGEANNGARATATVDNLWKCLLDIMEDEAVTSMHIVLNNAHCLDANNSSTTAFLGKLREHAFNQDQLPPAQRRVRWLITSRNERFVSEPLASNGVSLVDLEDDSEFGAKIKDARLMHAKTAVAKLKHDKEYGLELAYFVSRTLQNQSEDVTWIDIVCILLSAKPANSTEISIRRWLREIGSYNIRSLIDHCWRSILDGIKSEGTQLEKIKPEDTKLEIEELMCALTIAFEPPTMAELSVLTQIQDLKRLKYLVKLCSPVVRIASDIEHKNKVVFANPQFKQRLAEKYNGEPEQKKHYHGLVAIRCFKHIKSHYRSKEFSPSATMAGLRRSKTVKARVDKKSNVVISSAEDDEHDESDLASDNFTDAECLYPVRWLFEHLSEDPDTMQELFGDDPNFWGNTSELRNRWLAGFQVLSADLKDLSADGMSALHIASGIGAEKLVSLLVDKNGKASLEWKDHAGMTALHVAAHNNKADVVTKLLQIGAKLDAGEGHAGTPLHYAALQGHCSVMELLINKGANVNAYSTDIGPVINAAIRSGKVEAVKRVMNGDVRFDTDYTKCAPPLSLSAGISEATLFRDILDQGRDKWLQNVKLIDQALLFASYSGKLESVHILLDFEHTYTNNTLESAILSAACQNEWDVVGELLDFAKKDIAAGKRRDFQLDEVFYLAAAARQEQPTILKKIWSFTERQIRQDVLDYALYQATWLRKDGIATWLLETCKADANTTAVRPAAIKEEYEIVQSTQDYWNALNAAAKNGSALLTKELIKKGAEVDSDHGYALQLAARDGHVEVVEVLVAFGADISKQVVDSAELNFTHGTALQAACDYEHTTVVETLLKHGADPNRGKTAFTYPIISATHRNHYKILDLLLAAPNIDVNVHGGDEKTTPLINAATYMSTATVALLLEKGAAIDAKNAAGDTALIMAAHMGKDDCVELLCNSGADVTYRSPARGLPIQVAADARQPQCGRILSERMVRTIEDFREQAPLTKSQVEGLQNMIMDLEAELNETKDQLNNAEHKASYHDKENKRLEHENSYHGEQYESARAQIKSMQMDRQELERQINASKGRIDLANDRTAEVQILLEQERQTSDKLRNRHNWNELQEEKKEALRLYEAKCQESEDLQSKINELLNHFKDQEQRLSDSHRDLEMARVAIGKEKQEQESLRTALANAHQEKTTLQTTTDELQGRIDAILLATGRPQSPPVQTQTPPLQASPRPNEARTTSGFYFPPRQPVGVPDRAMASQPQSPEMIDDGMVMVEKSDLTSSAAEVKSPGFTTIHGFHRPNGALGGWRTDTTRRRLTNDSLYEASVKARSTNGESSGSVHSDDQVIPGTPAAQRLAEQSLPQTPDRPAFQSPGGLHRRG